MCHYFMAAAYNRVFTPSTTRLSGGSHRCRIPCVTIGGAHPWHLFLLKAEHCNGDTFRCKQVFQKKYFARRRQGSSGKKSGSDPMNSSPGSPRKIAVLSATPQHSSAAMASGDAVEFALRNGVTGEFRLRCGCVAGDPKRSPPCPAWLPAVVADVAAKFRRLAG